MYLRGKNLFCLMLVAVMSMVGMAATIADAEAKSRTCRKLETQLAAASGGSSSKAKRYDRAIANRRKNSASFAPGSVRCDAGSPFSGIMPGNARNSTDLPPV